MLGMMNKGGQNSPQGMGQNPNLAALFGGNMPAAPGGAPGQLPQIMPPQMPNIGMPPRIPMQQPVAPVNDAAAQRLKMLQDMALRDQANGQGRAGRINNWGTNPQWVGVGGRNAR